MPTPKQIVQDIIGSFGYEVRVKRDSFAFCTAYNCKTVLDIGADRGAFAQMARTMFPTADIHSFEPLPKSYATLVNTMKGDAQFFAHHVALGDRETEVEFNQNEFSPSSSILPLAKAHLDSFAEAREVTRVTVNQTTLDKWSLSKTLRHPLMIKIDVQGYEARVIAGGREMFSKADVVISEVSFVTLFEGQVLFDSLVRTFSDLGLKCVGITNILYDRVNGRPLQGDLICDRGASV